MAPFFGGRFFGGGFFGVIPAGSAKSTPRFIARYKDQDYYFRTVDELEQFVSDVRKAEPKLESRKARKKAKRSLTVRIEPAFQDELYAFDMPSVAPIANRFDFDEIRRLLARFDQLKALIDDDDDEAMMLLL